MINLLTFLGLVVAVFCSTLLAGTYMAWSSDDDEFMFPGAWVVACIALIVSIMMQIDISLID